MIIGIDGSRAFIKNRTGIEEYSYQVIKNLRDNLEGHQVVLYVRNGQQFTANSLQLPKNWKVKVIKWPRFWTQAGLSLEMFLHPVDVLFIPAHTVPCIHSKNTIVTIHGLEYEFCPDAYSFLERLYMRCSIKNSCKWARTIISVSRNTKADLIKLYNIKEDKIRIIYEGYDRNFQFPISNLQSNSNEQISNDNKESISHKLKAKSYLLFIGRIEERKNVANIVNTFEILKEQYKIPHKLILAGKPGFGYEKIKDRIANVNCRKDIVELGFVSEEEKWNLLKNADVFIFPTLYEGFGIPILEAQSVGVPVVASKNSSIPEVVNDSALLVDSNNAEEIADAVYKIISDDEYKKDLIQKGLENVKRFSWSKCAREIENILVNF